jgi:hypothetical protein
MKHPRYEDYPPDITALSFVFGENPASAATDEHLRFRQELVNFGQALLEAT